MNILAYLYCYPPHRYTGGELMTADLLEHLVRKGHTVHVYSDHVYGNHAYERNGVIVQSSAYLHYDMGYDVFITHPEIRTGAIQWMKGVPYIGIVHNTSVGTMRSLERQAPHLTVVNSEDTRKHVPEVAHTTGKGVVVIHPPVLLRPLDGGQEGNDRHDLPVRHFVTAINLSHEKGGAVLRYVAERNPTVPFLGVLGGHGPQIDDQPDNVTVIGPQDDMKAVYDATKVLLFPTKRESYGKVAAEAMQWGIPLIVSDLPALHEVCGDAAMFIDPHSYAAWDVALQVMQFDVHDKYASLSKERGAALLAKSHDDLDRWERLVREVAGK